MTRAQVDGIEAVGARGVTSFKFFPGYVGDQAVGFGMNAEGCPPDLFFEACERIARCPSPSIAMVHAEDPFVRGVFTERARQEGWPDTLSAWADATPDWAESAQVFTYAHVARQASVPLYVVHVSAGRTVETIRYLKQQGFRVIGETLAAFLAGTAEELDQRGLGARAKIQPPIRREADRDALWSGIASGTIDHVGTDSVAYTEAFKTSSPFWDTRVGANLQMADTIPLLFSQMIARDCLDLSLLVKLISENAARTFGLYPRKGCIAVGSDADLVVVDPERTERLGVARYRSGADYSLWEGVSASGIPVMTFLAGDLVMRDGEIVSARPSGRMLHES
jgi:dihydroorotase-like cyclic amidohydrolase